MCLWFFIPWDGVTLRQGIGTPEFTTDARDGSRSNSYTGYAAGGHAPRGNTTAKPLPKGAYLPVENPSRNGSGGKRDRQQSPCVSYLYTERQLYHQQFLHLPWFIPGLRQPVKEPVRGRLRKMRGGHFLASRKVGDSPGYFDYPGIGPCAEFKPANQRTDE